MPPLSATDDAPARVASEADFRALLQRSHPGLLVLQFTASWCARCHKVIEPGIRDILARHSRSAGGGGGAVREAILWAQIDVDADATKQIVESMNVVQMPCFLLLRATAETPETPETPEQAWGRYEEIVRGAGAGADLSILTQSLPTPTLTLDDDF